MKQIARALVTSLSLLGCIAALGRSAELPDVMVADFEGADYGSWKATGEAFGPGPARGTLPGQMKVDGFLGKGLVNSFYHGDKSTGTLTSAPFKIERSYINFLIGGGKDSEKLRIDLLVDEKAVLSASGPNEHAGGSERLDWHTWDVKKFRGKTATIQIVDRATAGWGHINVDQIVQSERKANLTLANAERVIGIEHSYLNLPVKNGGPKRRVSYLAGGQTVREFEIELADGAPDFWVFSDVRAFQGKDLTVRVDRMPETSEGLTGIECADSIRGAEDLYREKLRPQFHFSSRRGWNNDPNGLVYSAGEYHLYYQHNPYGWDWGNMHWGHAVSRDLVHWEELPIALYPKRFGDWAFSGSAVVDKKNTSGFKTGKEEVLVAAFTSTGRGECILYSNDRGRSWTEYSGNPVVKHRGRDPKLIWHEPTRNWVMALYDEGPEGTKEQRTIAFYTSDNLKKWTYRSKIDGFFECPDIFELPVDGDPSNRKWVLTAADDDYMIGSFDGKEFKKESGKHKGHYGNCFYAAQTYSDVEDGRRIQIGWGQAKLPGMSFNQMMAFPCELTLHTTPAGVRMFARPVKEIESLHGKHYSRKGVAIGTDKNPMAEMSGELLDLRTEIDLQDAEKIAFSIRGIAVEYDAKKKELSCQGKKAVLPPQEGRIRLQMLVDRASIEIFGNDGLVYMPIYALPKADNRTIELTASGGEARATLLDVYELKPAWQLAKAEEKIAAAPRPQYEHREQHSRDGIGKFYLGREIAHVMGHQGADWLERPTREQEEKTDLLVDSLKIKSGEVIADIGAGTGYFCRKLSPKTGEKGTIYAVDIQPEMLDLLTNTMAGLKVRNVRPILGTITDPKLPPGQVDTVLMVDVYHEFDHPYEMMENIVKGLKPGGRVVFVEFRGEDPEVPIKALHKMTEAQVKKEMAPLPLRWSETIEVLPRQHIIIFRKKDLTATANN
jgi:fructan beta-fructosidase